MPIYVFFVFNATSITDILPSDDILQRYMAHLEGEPVEQRVLNEIKEYEKRLKKRCENDSELGVSYTQIVPVDTSHPSGLFLWRICMWV